MKLIPLRSFFIVSCIAPTIQSSTPSTECSDDANYTSDHIENLNCRELRLNTSLRQEYCTYDEVTKACPVSCGICCDDNPTFTIKIRDGDSTKKIGCDWIGKMKARRKKYCYNIKKKALVQAACPDACALCPDPIHECSDDANYSSDHIDNFNCKELGSNESLRREYCTYDEVTKACPVACGICCDDSRTFRFMMKPNNERSCDWIGKVKYRRKKYCFNFKKKASIQANCPGVCALCRDPISPTTSPQGSPSSTRIPTFTSVPTSAPVDQWSFIVLADWHKAEYFATQPWNDTKYYKETYDQVKYIKDNYGGDLVVSPGDTNGALPGGRGGGKWQTKDFATLFNPELSVKKRVEMAGNNCYSAVREIFIRVGYPLLLVAVGDHEIGGNGWGKGDVRHMEALPVFRSSFAKWYNTDYTTGKLLQLRERIGPVYSRPHGTQFENTTYAYQHKNVLFITIDAFKQMPDALFDRAHGVGGEGVITCTVDGTHLAWFEQILKEARNNGSISHIIVQAHVPVIQPIRQVACSGQFMDYGEKSAFWKIMVKYNVDIYLAGEVHANTVTKDPDSNLLQIVSRGNQFNNFLKIEVTNHTLHVTSYNEVGTKRMNNMNYTVHGRLMVDKTDCMSDDSVSRSPSNKPVIIPSKKPSISPSDASNAKRTTLSNKSPKPSSSPHKRVIFPRCKSARITASGVLEPLDRISALLHFNFEEILPLGSREVIGLQHDNHTQTLVARSITIRGIKSNESLPNLGSFAQLYDAQIANITLVHQPSSRGTYYAQFTENSRFGIFANGPHNPGIPVSFALWIKFDQSTRETSNEMLLVHYGNNFGVNSKKSIFTLTLNNGTPALYNSPTSVLVPEDSFTLGDDEWHHIAVSMPKHSCKLSEVVIYIDGTSIRTKTTGNDKHIFFVTSGRVSIGGFGHSSPSFESAYPHVSSYVGAVDDFSMWSRTLELSDLPTL